MGLNFLSGHTNVLTIAITLIECAVLFYQVFHVLCRPNDKSRLRFLTLTLTFVLYNITSIWMPTGNSEIRDLGLACFAFGRGAILGGVYFYFLLKELDIGQQRFFNVKTLLLSLGLFFLLGYVFLYNVSNHSEFAYDLFVLSPLVIAVYFCLKTIQFTRSIRTTNTEGKSSLNLMVIFGYIGMILISSLPIIVYMGDYHVVNIIVVNLSFFVIFYAYIQNHLFQARTEYELLTNMGYFKKKEPEEKKSLCPEIFKRYNLTTREIEIAFRILSGIRYKDIAEEMFIAPKTVSKHASNIFKKTDCQNRVMFMDVFSENGEKIQKINLKAKGHIITEV